MVKYDVVLLLRQCDRHYTLISCLILAVGGYMWSFHTDGAVGNATQSPGSDSDVTGLSCDKYLPASMC